MKPHPRTKHPNVAAELRRLILDGVLPPGSRLATRQELERRFEVSRVTMQKAAGQLEADGFLVSRGRHGTYVANHLPHRGHFGLVFPDAPVPGSLRPRYFTALLQEAHALSGGSGARVSLYYGHVFRPEPDFQRLEEDVRHHRLAGLIFPIAPGGLFRGSAALTEPGLARVAVTDVAAPPGVHAITLDMRSFFARALAELQRTGCRRVALLTVPHPPTDWETVFGEELRRRQLVTRPYWHQYVPVADADCARRVTHLLFAANLDDRPDGLIIADDNLAEPAEAGLIDAGVRVPEDLRVIAHCNFPWPTPSPLPVRRLGFDMQALLRHAVTLLGDGAAGEGRPPEHFALQPVFSEEACRGAREATAVA